MGLNSKTNLLKIAVFLAGVQALRAAVTWLALRLLPNTDAAFTALTCVLMLALAIGVLLLARKKGLEMNMLPPLANRRDRLLYGLVTAAFLVLFLSGLVMTRSSGEAILMAVSGCVVTPFFEETMFRGFVWSHLSGREHNERRAAILCALLFSVWHIGYADSVLIRMTLHGQSGSLPFILAMKAAVGLGYGIVLSLVRYKAKNAYAGMLVHGLLNLFGR